MGWKSQNWLKRKKEACERLTWGPMWFGDGGVCFGDVCRRVLTFFLFQNPRSNRAPLTSRRRQVSPSCSQPSNMLSKSGQTEFIRRRAATVINKTRPSVCTQLARPELLCSWRHSGLYSHQPKCVGMLTEPRQGRTVMCVMQLSGVGCSSTGCLLRLRSRTSSSHHCVYVTGFKWPRKTRWGGRFTDFDSIFIALYFFFFFLSSTRGL